MHTYRDLIEAQKNFNTMPSRTAFAALMNAMLAYQEWMHKETA
jgi:hypothetical protein